MPRGQKTCGSCNFVTGPRAFTCPKCNAPFKFAPGKGVAKENSTPVAVKLKKRTGMRVDWRLLKTGDYIKVLSGSGPFWVRNNGEREPMGYYGKFRVSGVGEDGIHAYPTDTKNSGHCYIYMGPKRVGSTGMRNRPHKIRQITKPKITNFIMSKYND